MKFWVESNIIFVRVCWEKKGISAKFSGCGCGYGCGWEISITIAPSHLRTFARGWEWLYNVFIFRYHSHPYSHTLTLLPIPPSKTIISISSVQLELFCRHSVVKKKELYYFFSVRVLQYAVKVFFDSFTIQISQVSQLIKGAERWSFDCWCGCARDSCYNKNINTHPYTHTYLRVLHIRAYSLFSKKKNESQ